MNAQAPSGREPLLSLCLATFNRARVLDRYLSHHLRALEQAGVDYELVVSDNCSSDETPEILARYSGLFPRMRVTRQARNVGAYPNILTTLRQARGQVVVSIADDDLAVVDRLLDYVQRLVADPAIVMIQAPWLLMKEDADNTITGKFYDIPEERRFGRGDYANALSFMIKHHVFPECWILRRSALGAVADSPRQFTYLYFAMLAHALRQGDVLFCPEPHIMASIGAVGPEANVGHGEAMGSWDVYRGGLELLASYARQYNPGVLTDPDTVGQAITRFTCVRMGVAARLQVQSRNWSNAYQILRRLHAYGAPPQVGVAPAIIARLAALETALAECVQLGALEIVVGDQASDAELRSINPVAGVRFMRAADLYRGTVKRAYCSSPLVSAGEQDFAYDLAQTEERFPPLS